MISRLCRSFGWAAFPRLRDRNTKLFANSVNMPFTNITPNLLDQTLLVLSCGFGGFSPQRMHHQV